MPRPLIAKRQFAHEFWMNWYCRDGKPDAGLTYDRGHWSSKSIATAMMTPGGHGLFRLRVRVKLKPKSAEPKR